VATDPDVRRFRTAEATDDLLLEVRRLLDRAFAGDFSDDDWRHALGGWHVVVVTDGAVVAHAAVVPRLLEVGTRQVRAGYVEGVATDPGRQGEGWGTVAMTEVSALLHDEFEIGALSTGLPGFYGRLGWERWQGPTFARHGERRLRTEDDDDGVMVLRFDATSTVDLTSALTCEGREGDDW
jgi:aminoglycoside 2'-N-acetyltransferase I